MGQEKSLDDALAELLRQARLDAGLSLSDLADRTGIPMVSVQRYLSGKRPVNVSTLSLMCHALGLRAGAMIEQAEAIATTRGVDQQLVSQVLVGLRKSRTPAPIHP